jgi:serine protease Do
MKEMRMRTWTVVALALVAASVGTTAAVLPDDSPAVTAPQQPPKLDNADRSDAGGMIREVQRRVMAPGGADVHIGVTIRDLEGDQVRTKSGAVVSDVREDSPAAKAGIRSGDVIVEFDGERIRSARHLSRLVGETAAGRAVKVTVDRDGKRMDLEVAPEAGLAMSDGDFRFRGADGAFDFNAPNFSFDAPRMRELFEEHGHHQGDRPDTMVIPQGRGRLGIGIQDLSPQLAEYFGTKGGVLVTSVEEDSPAAKAGLKAGDVITAVGDTPVNTPSDLMRAVRRAEDGGDLSIGYTRDKKSATTHAKLEPRKRERREGAPI